MSHTPHAFENQIFDHFRKNAEKINKAIEFLVEHNYTVINLEGQIITKETIDEDDKPVISPTRYSKRNRD